MIDPAYLKSRAAWAGDVEKNLAVFWISTEPGSLPQTYRHWGPPSDNRHSSAFRERWKGRKVMDEGGRLYVDLRRDRTDPEDIVEEVWAELGHGPDISPLRLRRFETL